KTSAPVLDMGETYFHRLHPLYERRDDILSPLRYAKESCHAVDVLEDVGKTRWLQIHYLGRPRQRGCKRRNRTVIDRADIAQMLGQNKVGSQAAQKRFVHAVERARGGERRPDPAIYL